MDADLLHPAITAAFEAELPDPDYRTGLLTSIHTAYTSPGRHYHNLRHLAHLADELAQVRSAVEDWNLLMLAAAYHDVVYDAARGDNEEASAMRAGSELHIFVNASRLQRLQDIILATKHHDPSTDGDTDFFCDADLAILGAAPDRYDAYAAAIRREYAQYPDVAYNPGRAAVLQKLLQQAMLFKTAAFRARLESVARSNIARELTALQR